MSLAVGVLAVQLVCDWRPQRIVCDASAGRPFKVRGKLTQHNGRLGAAAAAAAAAPRCGPDNNRAALTWIRSFLITGAGGRKPHASVSLAIVRSHRWQRANRDGRQVFSPRLGEGAGGRPGRNAAASPNSFVKYIFSTSLLLGAARFAELRPERRRPGVRDELGPVQTIGAR
jgi:hypothetical protein